MITTPRTRLHRATRAGAAETAARWGIILLTSAILEREGERACAQP